MSIFITGDTHKDFTRFSSTSFKEGRNLTKDDYVIILGDFGGIWDVNKSREDEDYWLKWLGDKPWTTLFVDGNHENFDRIEALPQVMHNKLGAVVGVAPYGILHLKRGEIYEIQGKKFFVFGGGFSIDRAYRREFTSWWSQEMPNQKDYDRAISNLNKVGWKVDYILTHSASFTIVKWLEINQYIFGKAHENQLQKFLEMIKNNCIYKKWFCGHFHLNLKYDEKHIMFSNRIMNLEEVEEVYNEVTK